MCRILQIPRSTYYFEVDQKKKDEKVKAEAQLTDTIVEIFNNNRKSYGTRRMKNELDKIGLTVSRRKIGRIMRQNGLVSVYKLPRFKNYRNKPNEKLISNHLNRSFKRERSMEVLVSDLTYVDVGGKWHYICIFVDLFNREIVGYSAGRHKDTVLVSRALSTIKGNLKDVQMFHTDRGKEFDNQSIDEALNAFGITRSLSMKGCPYDNAVAEATFKSIKTEFIKQFKFKSLKDLELELFDYIHWYNNIRSHSTLDYLSPINYKKQFIKSV